MHLCWGFRRWGILWGYYWGGGYVLITTTCFGTSNGMWVFVLCGCCVYSLLLNSNGICLCCIVVIRIVHSFDGTLSFICFTSDIIFSCIISLHRSVIFFIQHHTLVPVFSHEQDLSPTVTATSRPPSRTRRNNKKVYFSPRLQYK